MGKLLYSVAMSLDGFIAGPGGDMSWLAEHLAPNPVIDELIGEVGALLVGNRTFRGSDPYEGMEGEGEAFGGGWSGPEFVLTHNPPATPVPGVTFVTGFDEAVALAREAARDKYVNVLGADIARQCVEADVLDEVLVSVAPVMLGDGVRLFDRQGGAPVPLERLSQSEMPHPTTIWLRVVR
ncbi:dihydrofolate reductase family protein [Streptomyces johnsoniae]|uniref:Dihydrofolate reductase family protein n=1 Tax=Streptomyces johnsoniae TaxID=3075532 RepID=A0ABU2S3D1_9ACTN|nr:dihydrofolate reductase family protein [Streptomyces sp. DSM 41886]MDT0443499.1 dihydrofolate reductase family protein [Streptomyces sp. DSM 41886]